MSIRDDIKKVMVNAISQNLKVPQEKITEDVKLTEDLGAKSADFVRIIGDVEDEFEFTVPFMKFRKQETLGDCIDFAVSVFES